MTTMRSGRSPGGSAGARKDSGCASGKPCSSASSLTGEAVRRRPRPAGRSGCVSTSGTRAPAATIARSAGTAKCGVPANAMRASACSRCTGPRRLSDHGHGRATARIRSIGRGALRFLDGLLFQALALQLGEVVDEQLAFEVVHLVLNADREHAVGVELERLAVGIERSDADRGGAIDEVVELGHRKAPFLGVSLTLGMQDFGVDQAQRLLALDDDIADKDALVDVDLGGRKPDAGSRIHGLEHVGDQSFELGIEFCDRLRANSEARVGILQYWKACHCGSALVSCITRCEVCLTHCLYRDSEVPTPA